MVTWVGVTFTGRVLDGDHTMTRPREIAMRSFLFLLLLLPAARADDPVFVARTAAGKDVRGPIASLAAGWDLEMGDKVRRRIAGKELLALRQEGVTPPELPAGQHLVLANGDRVPFSGARLDDEKLLFKHPDLGNVSIPLTAISLIWRAGLDRRPVPERLRRQLLAGKRSRDEVWLCNGDLIEGTLIGLADSVEVERERKTLRASWAQVAAIALAPFAAERPKPPGLTARVVVLPSGLSPGGRFTVHSPGLTRDELHGKTLFGATLRVPLARVALIEVIGGAGVPLSSLTPGRYTFTPFLDEKVGWSRDATATGRDLRVGGGTYDHGIGMHAESSLTFALDGAYRRFEALVGLDDREGRRGQVRVVVRVDGKEADLGRKVLTHGEPLRVAVDLAGAKSLTLEVRYADRGPVQAVVNWAEARLVR